MGEKVGITFRVLKSKRDDFREMCDKHDIKGTDVFKECIDKFLKKYQEDKK